MKMRIQAALLIFGSILSLPMAQASENQESLVEVRSKDFGDDRFLMTIKEMERHPQTSKLRLTYKEMGSSVGSSMFITRAFYEVAKARGAKYFVVLREWTDAEGGRIYIAGFTDDKNADLKKVFGEEFDYQNEHGQTRELVSVSQFRILFEQDTK